MKLPEQIRELRPHATWDAIRELIREAIKLMLPFLAGLGIKAWVHEYATPLMWTGAVAMAALVAYSDRLPRLRKSAGDSGRQNATSTTTDAPGLSPMRLRHVRNQFDQLTFPQKIALKVLAGKIRISNSDLVASMEDLGFNAPIDPVARLVNFTDLVSVMGDNTYTINPALAEEISSVLKDFTL